MKQAELLKKIEQLEARVRELEARPVYVPYYAGQYQQPHQPPSIGPWPYWQGPYSGTPLDPTKYGLPAGAVLC